ncbi:hypothetical protein KDK95_20735 [Actinospica sp. MGRD01-02]|uniref:Uncharacterized protein n=1 Tax=Actinospica acidithermotolerans TaxID=2828514 RepID=A0A941IL64_9ACTN|nr:hypothetical protein [Actinospica acidithermotolerans]MBR7828748.1 hypothetical protein [Actinospica acidithermotolerans]
MATDENNIVTTGNGNGAKYALESAPIETGQVLYSITRLTRSGEAIPVGKLTIGPDTSLKPQPGLLSVYFGEGNPDVRHERTDVPLVGASMYLVNRKRINPEEMGEDGENLTFHYSMAPTHMQRFSLSNEAKEQRRAAAMVAAIVKHYQARPDLEEIAKAADHKRDLARLESARKLEQELQAKIAEVGEAYKRTLAGLNLSLADLTEEITVLELITGATAEDPQTGTETE